MTRVPVERLAAVFVEVADTLVDEFDVIDFLQMVVSRTSEFGHATAAGLLLTDARGGLQVAAASEERARVLELFQVQAEEGPCREAFRSGTAVSAADLAASGSRWPGFAPLAQERGIRSVHAFPLRLRRQVIGALGLFGEDTGGMDAEDARVVQALADVATIGLLQERAIRRGELLTEQLEGALTSRIAIEQAKGAIAQRYGCEVDEAFELLRGYARRHRLPLREVAEAVTSQPPGITDLREG